MAVDLVTIEPAPVDALADQVMVPASDVKIQGRVIGVLRKY